MEFTLRLDSTDDHATTYPQQLVAQCLIEVAQAVTHGTMAGRCNDDNGNKVGEWKLTLPKPKRTTRP